MDEFNKKHVIVDNRREPKPIPPIEKFKFASSFAAIARILGFVICGLGFFSIIIATASPEELRLQGFIISASIIVSGIFFAFLMEMAQVLLAIEKNLREK